MSAAIPFQDFHRKGGETLEEKATPEAGQYSLAITQIFTGSLE
jgi:hypothetical protein